jgi:HEAT repeat protein
MSHFDDLKDVLLLYSTHENHPTQVDEAYAILRESGESAIDVLIWGLQQGDTDLAILVMELLQQFYSGAQQALPAVRRLIRDDQERLVRVTAICTANELGDCSEEFCSLIADRLESVDRFEQLQSAMGLWRIRRSEDAYRVLRQLANGDKPDLLTETAREILES